MIATIAMATDVITKKNGTTIQCKVVKVGRTEVEYKIATNLNGPIYAIDLTEISSIKYENGTVDKFGEQSAVTTNAGQRTMTDAELMRMYNQMNSNSRPKHPGRGLKTTGYILGGLGIGLIALSIDQYSKDYREADYSEIGDFLVVAGSVSVIAGTTCYFVGRHKANKAKRYNDVTLFQQDFPLGNNSKLSADVNMINDNMTRSKSLGLGVRYTF